jgi:hypothetical protein
MKKIVFLFIAMTVVSFAQTKEVRELEKRIARCDTLQNQILQGIIRIPEAEQLKQLAIQARDIELQRSVFLSLKSTFTDSLWLKQDSLATEPKKTPH